MSCTRLVRFALSLPLLTLACGSEEQSGVVTVTYEIVPNQSCEAVGATQVRVTLTGGGQSFEGQAPCSSGSVTLDYVKAGHYDIVVEAIDGVGDTIYDSEGSPPMKYPVEVLGGASNNIENVELFPTPATLKFVFQVTDSEGLFQQCAASEIKHFYVRAVRNSQTMAEHTFDYCEASGKVTMLDPERRIEGDLLNLVRIQPQNASNQALSSLDVSVDPPGHGKTVEIRVDCVDTTCDGVVTSSGSSTDDGDTSDPTAGTGGAGTGG